MIFFQQKLLVISSFDLHFWYLYFVGIILTSKVVPGPRTRGSIGAGVHQRCGGTVLAAMDRRSLLDAVHADRYAAIGIDQRARLAQFRIIKGLFERKEFKII